jgi:hypothetical protein
VTGTTSRRWPLALLALPAAVAIWSGWVGLGQMAGFGVVHPLPGIADGFELNTAITLPIGVEAYASLALGTWLTARPIPRKARRFAAWSSLAALGLGLLGQVVYHLLTAADYTSAPIPVVVFVACLPVLVLGAGAALHHLLGDPTPPVSGGVDADAPMLNGSEPAEEVPSRPTNRLGWDSSGCPGAGVPPVPTDDGHGTPLFAVNGSPEHPALPAGPGPGRDAGTRRALSQADRARTVAEQHAARTGGLPTVRELAQLAEVGRGTADRALAPLRAAGPSLDHEAEATANGGPPDSAGRTSPRATSDEPNSGRENDEKDTQR